MTKRFYETAEFRQQQNEWYQKLKDAGFRELEVRGKGGRDTGLLNGVSPGDLARGLYDPAIERYYALCRAHVHRMERRLWANSSRPGSGELAHDLAIWSLHSEGLRPPAISRHLGLPRARIVAVVKREEVMMRRAEDRADATEEKGLTDE